MIYYWSLVNFSLKERDELKEKCKKQENIIEDQKAKINVSKLIVVGNCCIKGALSQGFVCFGAKTC